MTTRLAGAPGSRRRRRFLFAPVLLVVLAAVVLIGGAQAVHDENLFELGGVQAADILGDGNAANGPDWADIFDGNGNVISLFGGTAAAFIDDDTSLKGGIDRSTFSGAGGSNKNNDPISADDCAARTPPLTGSACDTWHWDSGNVPAKDDLINAYTYATFNAAEDLIIYSGLERLDESGDSHIDLEFLQNPVAIVDGQLRNDAAVPCNDPGSDPTPCDWAGIRTIGDVIISMDFVQGGGLGEVTVREWDGNQYVLEGIAGGEGCNGGDTICAFNNGASIDGGPWPNLDKTGATVTNLLPNAFSEIGVNVTQLLGFTPCIGTVMGKTRSSQSFTAELKDFTVPASFPVCSAAIAIAPDDVNEVGESHTFTVTVSKNVGATSTPAPDGTDVDVTLTGVATTISKNTCDTDANDPDTGLPGVGTVGGTCIVTFTSNSAGTVTGHASADVDLGSGITSHVETDGTGSNSGDAVKRFVDLAVSITPSATNGITESHTFNITVTAFPAGSTVTFGAITPSVSPAPDSLTSTCASPSGSGNTRTCTVTISNDTAGTFTANVSASATFTSGSASDTVTRSTSGNSGPGGSGPATKVFVAGSLAWFKNDNAGQRQGGATFEVCRTADRFGNAVSGECQSVTDNAAPDTDTDNGEFKLAGLPLGHYTVRETAAPAGFELDPSVKEADLTLANPDATISTAFVNQRPILKITGFGYTNAATGTPTAGIVSGVATYTVSLHNYGGAAATLSNSSLAVSVTGGGAGTVTCGGNPVPVSPAITGTVAAGGNLTPPFTLACTYSNMADGAVITATLNVKYTTNGLERVASGSPATISFTVQSD